MIKRIAYRLTIFLVTAVAALAIISDSSIAAFNRNRIMDEIVFDRSFSLNAAQIDAWLNSNFPSSCISTNRGFQTQDITGYSPSTGFTYGANVSAGTAIEHAAKAYDINPQVLLVTLQKEQSLVTGTGSRCLSTDANLRAKAYAAAMGYNCPDNITLNDYSGINLYTINGVTVTSVNDTCVDKASTVGFSRQLINAAWKLKFNEQRSIGNVAWNVQKPGWDNSDDPPMTYSGPMTQGYRARYSGGPVVYYDGYHTIDGVTIHIDTGPTASFYYYTPHFAGNENLVSIFESWFGSTTAINGSVTLFEGLTLSGSGTRYVGETVTASYKIKNTASFDVYVGGVGVCGRLNGQYYDLGFVHHQYIPANGTITVSYNKTLTTPGSLYLFICSYHPEMGWASNRYPYDTGEPLTRNLSATVAENPVISSGIMLGPANPGIDQTVDAYVSIRNAGSTPVNIGSLVVAARDPSGKNVDFPIKNDVTIPANTTQTLKWSRVFITPGNYSFHIANWDGVWRTDYPKSANNFVIRQLNWPILDNPLISSGITVATPTPAAGQPVDVTLTFRNTSGSDINIGSVVIAARNSAGGNVDFPLKNDVIIPANNTKTFTWTRTFSSPGSYSLFVANWNGIWTTSYPKSMNESVQRQMTINVN